MYYAETMTATGKWVGCTYAEKPEVKNGAVRMSDMKIRNVVRIADKHKQLDIGTLSVIYGTNVT